MKRQAALLVTLGGAALLYLLSRTQRGQAMRADLVERIANLITGEEGVRLSVYKDSGGAWTVGRGHLILSTDTVVRNGRAVKLYPFGPRDPKAPTVPTGERNITRAESDAFFAKDSAIARHAVESGVKVPVTDNQKVALSSLVFNIGANAFATSTLLRKLNAGDIKGAADEFLRWKYDNGVEVPALLARRERERKLFLS